MPTHLVQGTDVAIPGLVLLVNQSVQLDSFIGLELWRRPPPKPQQHALPTPPLQRLVLTCRAPVAFKASSVSQHASSGHGGAAIGGSSSERMQGAEGRDYTRGWTLSNSWDHLASNTFHPPRDDARGTAYADNIWRCMQGEGGRIALHWDEGSRSSLGRLVSVSVSARLVSTRLGAAGKGGWRGHILVVAAWNQECNDIEEAPPGEACRTLFTSTRLEITAALSPAPTCQPL